VDGGDIHCCLRVLGLQGGERERRGVASCDAAAVETSGKDEGRTFHTAADADADDVVVAFDGFDVSSDVPWRDWKKKNWVS
jgi:hypothetical protein